MKKLIFLALLSPLFSMGQSKKNTKRTSITASAKKEIQTLSPNTFIINGNIKGLNDGASVGIYNFNTRQVEEKAKANGGKFSFTGNVNTTSMEYMVFNNQIPLKFILEQGQINIEGNINLPDEIKISGTESNKIFNNYVASIFENEKAIKKEEAFYDKKNRKEILEKSKLFIEKNKNSIVSNLAVLKLIETNPWEEETIFLLNNSLTNKNNPIASEIMNWISTASNMPLNSPIKDFSQADTSGKQINFATFAKDKIVLVDFWASWCGPCRKENPNVVAAFNKFKDKNFTVLGVSFDRENGKENWINAIKNDNLTWEHVSDLQYWNNAAGKLYGVSSIPQNILVKDGKIIGKNLRGAELIKKLNDVIL